MGAALKTGVERVVYTSSVAALKPGDTAVDESSSATRMQSVIGAYKRSKAGGRTRSRTAGARTKGFLA